jgi:DNA-damage-inducible protein D
MSTDLGIFHFEDGKPSFEDLGKQNGEIHWTEEILMKSLGYETIQSFRKAINRAKQACLSLNLTCEEHFVLQSDGSHLLTRFACYLIAMNGDSRKPQVASAQAWFATLAQTFSSSLEHADGIDRLLIRDEVTDGQKSLASTAKAHGVVRYDIFQNKGYMGMYNMSLDRLCGFKGVPQGQKLIDCMGKSELAAHLFRITQTDDKIKKEGIRGQFHLEKAAHDVGRKVRDTVIELSGTAPENLSLAENVNSVQKKSKALASS